MDIEILENVIINMHPVLADMLWSNLFQNAVLHNTKNGKIRVRLTESKLMISNTGPGLDINPDELFKRFRKADQNSQSIGLGLSIIKRIADQNDMKISYTHENRWHTIDILLNPVKIS